MPQGCEVGGQSLPHHGPAPGLKAGDTELGLTVPRCLVPGEVWREWGSLHHQLKPPGPTVPPTEATPAAASGRCGS